MIIGGFQKLTLIDYPGKIACAIFTRGCNFRCGYCHNRHLIYPSEFSPLVSEKNIFLYLDKYSKNLEGIVISGGEPTIQKDLPNFIYKLKRYKLPIKLDTNGSNPEILSFLITRKYIDFVAMDIKTTFPNYSKVCHCNIDIENIKQSIKIIQTSGIKHQFRTTFVSDLITLEDLRKIKTICDNSDYQIYNYVKSNSDYTVIENSEFNKIIKNIIP